MDYISNTVKDTKEMLATCKVSSCNDFFTDIPADLKIDNLHLDAGLSEMELVNQLQEIAAKNIVDFDSYLGGGAYEHFIPAVVKSLVSRGEFYTAYTPYQPEASQGTLQAIYEYQSLICELFKMDVSNASHYDGATALAEAVLMSYAVGTAKGKNKVLVSSGVSLEYREIIKTYTHCLPIEVKEIPLIDGLLDLEWLKNEIDEKTLSVVVANPNFLGLIEPMKEIEKLVHSQKALFITCVNPLSLGVLVTPGEYNADIAVAEGQPLGNALSFGGSYLGVFTCTKELMRKMPGRIVGKTKDKNGKDGYVLTLQAREQHIRREKATSNICSNQALNALTACIFLSVLGKKGITDVAKLNLFKSQYLFTEICKLEGFSALFPAKSFFNEFVIKSDRFSGKDIVNIFKANKIFPGITLENLDVDYKNALLVCVTETKSKAQLDRYVDVLKNLQ